MFYAQSEIKVTCLVWLQLISPVIKSRHINLKVLLKNSLGSLAFGPVGQTWQPLIRFSYRLPTVTLWLAQAAQMINSLNVGQTWQPLSELSHGINGDALIGCSDDRQSEFGSDMAATLWVSTWNIHKWWCSDWLKLLRWLTVRIWVWYGGHYLGFHMEYL